MPMVENAISLSDRVRLAHLIRSTNQHFVLIKLIRKHGWKRGAEIGVLRGKTLFALLEAIPDLTMFGVDQWQHISLRQDENAETYSDYDMKSLETLVIKKSRLFGGRCMILKGDSATIAGHMSADLDFVFIDADHTEKGLERDLLAWAPLVKAGGYVLGHDCHWSTVAKVINKRCPGWIDNGEAVWSIPREAVKL